MLEFQHYLHSLTRVFSTSRAVRQFKNSLLHSWLQQSQERDTMKAASGHLWWFKIVCFEHVDTGTKSSRQEAAKTSNSLYELKLFNEHLADRLTDSFGCCWEEGRINGSTDQRIIWSTDEAESQTRNSLEDCDNPLEPCNLKGSHVSG